MGQIAQRLNIVEFVVVDTLKRAGDKVGTKKRKRREVTLNRDGFRTVWFNGGGYGRYKEVNVEVFDKDNELVLEWAFPSIGGNLIGNSAVFVEQVIMYAKDPKHAIPKKQEGATA